jgi:hypothetical protein
MWVELKPSHCLGIAAHSAQRITFVLGMAAAISNTNGARRKEERAQHGNNFICEDFRLPTARGAIK